MQTHYSSDVGTAPLNPPPRTTGTLCGLRAPYDRINNFSPTCPDCQEERRKQKENPDELAKLLNEIQHKIT